MKPLLIALTILALGFTQPTFALDREVSPGVLKSFQTTFTAAKSVEWTITPTMYKARFELNAQVVTAYYNAAGTLVGVTRNITSHQLPLALQTSLKKGHEAFWITELFELSSEEGTAYYATLETAEQKVVLKSTLNGWTQYSKDKKDR